MGLYETVALESEIKIKIETVHVMHNRTILFY